MHVLHRKGLISNLELGWGRGKVILHLRQYRKDLSSVIIHINRFFYLVNLFFFFHCTHTHTRARAVYLLYLKNCPRIACLPAIAIVILTFMTFPRCEGRFPYRENDFRNIGYSLSLSLSLSLYFCLSCVRCRRIKSAQHRDCARAIVPPAADRSDCEMSAAAAFKANRLFFLSFFFSFFFLAFLAILLTRVILRCKIYASSSFLHSLSLSLSLSVFKIVIRFDGIR